MQKEDLDRLLKQIEPRQYQWEGLRKADNLLNQVKAQEMPSTPWVSREKDKLVNKLEDILASDENLALALTSDNEHIRRMAEIVTARMRREMTTNDER